MEKEELYNDDCIEVMKNLPEDYIDMVFCDLPYGTTQNSWDSMIAFDKLWENYDRIVKENGAIVLTSQQPFTSQLIMSNIKNFRYEWIWEKNKATGHLNAKRMPMKSHENICIFYKKLPMYNPQKTMDHKAYGAVKPNIPPSTEQKRNYTHHFQPGNDGNTTDRLLDIQDILVVAPFNVQVNYLKSILPKKARVGTIDIFQGQQAPVTIISMTSSDAESLPRNVDFYFSRNRLNVAVSRSQCLSIVIMNKKILEINCKKVEHIRLVNTFMKLLNYEKKN